MALNIPKSEIRGYFAKLRVYLTEGKDHEEIAGLFGFKWADYEEFLGKFYEQEVEDLRGRTTEHVYVDYCLHQHQNIHDLTKLVDHYDKTKQHAAVVSAVRARSEIYDKIIARGQELGFIDKKPETKLIAGMVVAHLSTKELRSVITQELSGLEKLFEEFGDAPNILDVNPGPTHVPVAKQKALPEGDPMKKRPKQNANKVHKGRRVVKKKAEIG